MIVYHGTTQERARRIAREGLRPRVPSKRVWFAQHRAYARQRAQSQARGWRPWSKRTVAVSVRVLTGIVSF